MRIGVAVGEGNEHRGAAIPHIGVVVVGLEILLWDRVLDARAIVDGEQMGVIVAVGGTELTVIARPVALDRHRLAVEVESFREPAHMRRTGHAVGHDLVWPAALRLVIEVHHLLDEPHVLRGERIDDLVDMGVPDIDLLAVHRVLAVEHDAIAELTADPVLVRWRPYHDRLAQRIDQRLRHGRRRPHGLDHPGHDRLHRQKRLALIKLACGLERPHQRLAAGIARLGDERIEVAVQDLEAERLVGGNDDIGNLWRKIDGKTDGIEPARFDLA